MPAPGGIAIPAAGQSGYNAGMVKGVPTERRQHPRAASAAALTLQHGPSRREFPARCVDLSAGGVLAAVPATMPVRVGHEVQVCARGAAGGGDAPPVLAEGPQSAVVVRVDRGRLLADGTLAVALRFG